MITSIANAKNPLPPPEKTGRATRENEEEGRTATSPHTLGRRPPSTTRRSASASWLMAEKAQ